MKTMMLLLSAFILTSVHAKNSGRTLASIKQDDRIEHSRELMGNNYRTRAATAQNVLTAVKRHLPKKYAQRAHDIAQAIITEAGKHALDPFFVMAVIAGESSFNPDARGPVGEIGLMQVRPATGKWIAKISKQKWNGTSSLKDPVANIRLGTAYLAWLRKKFDNHGQLYLAAYNMGPSNVKQALRKNVWPKDYPRHVMKRYLAFYKSIEVAKL